MPWYHRDSDAESAWYASKGFMVAMFVVITVVALVIWFGFMQPASNQSQPAPSVAVATPSDGQPNQKGQRSDIMKPSTKDQVGGRYDEAEGKVKEAAGVITDNPKLEAKGKAEKAAGRTQQRIGHVKKALGE